MVNSESFSIIRSNDIKDYMKPMDLVKRSTVLNPFGKIRLYLKEKTQILFIYCNKVLIFLATRT